MVRLDREWLERPVVGTAFPSRAWIRHQGGVAVLSCRVQPGGRVSDCLSLAEYPAGYGFGDGALKMTASFRFKDPDKGGPPVGKTVRIPVTFRTPWDKVRDPMHLRVGDSAMLVTGLPGARPPGREVIDCPDGEADARHCLWSYVRWTRQPTYEEAAAIIRGIDVRAGVSHVSCRANAGGDLADCRVGGVRTPKVEGACLELASRFTAAPEAQFGVPVTAGRVDFELNWALLRPLADPPG